MRQTLALIAAFALTNSAWALDSKEPTDFFVWSCHVVKFGPDVDRFFNLDFAFSDVGTTRRMPDYLRIGDRNGLMENLSPQAFFLDNSIKMEGGIPLHGVFSNEAIGRRYDFVAEGNSFTKASSPTTGDTDTSFSVITRSTKGLASENAFHGNCVISRWASKVEADSMFETLLRETEPVEMIASGEPK